jgi:hypothetical protein
MTPDMARDVKVDFGLYIIQTLPKKIHILLYKQHYISALSHNLQKFQCHDGHRNLFIWLDAQPVSNSTLYDLLGARFGE